jgi:hypothetical protein
LLTDRVRAAVLCVLLASGSILGTIPSCGRNITQAGPVCCKSAASCPMHHKHASFGFDVCRGDHAATSATTTSDRAVFATPLCVAGASHRDQSFETKTIFLPSVSIFPGAPPPRLG